MPLEDIFPGLSGTPYRITSLPDSLYNCFAWAGGESHRWWEAHPDAGHDWPGGQTEEWTIDVVVAAYRTLGYVECPDPALEANTEKVAIFARGDEPTHAARQLSSGRWTSKLGPEHDIEHTLDSLNGWVYGLPVAFVQRPRVGP